MIQPTAATRIAAHLLVGAAVAILAAKVFGKGASPACALIGVAAHEALDAPLARSMAANGIQL